MTYLKPSPKTLMWVIIANSIPNILKFLSSVDSLPVINGKTAFYDEERVNIRKAPKRGSPATLKKRIDIHLVDSWKITFTANERKRTAIIHLTNSRKTADGKWNVADLLWYGTRDYQIDAPEIKLTRPVIFTRLSEATPSKKGFQHLMKQIRALNKQGYEFSSPDEMTKIIQKEHHTKAMTFYNRYTGTWAYNRKFRRGIRDILVVSFRDYILNCVEAGIRKTLSEMDDEGILPKSVTDVHVRVI